MRIKKNVGAARREWSSCRGNWKKGWGRRRRNEEKNVFLYDPAAHIFWAQYSLQEPGDAREEFKSGKWDQTCDFLRNHQTEKLFQSTCQKWQGKIVFPWQTHGATEKAACEEPALPLAERVCGTWETLAACRIDCSGSHNVSLEYP